MIVVIIIVVVIVMVLIVIITITRSTRKGTNGVSSNGCIFLVFSQRDFLGAAVSLLLSPQKCQGVPFFPNLSKLLTFAAALLVLTPFVCNQQ